MESLDDKVSLACIAKSTVYFQVTQTKLTTSAAQPPARVTAFDNEGATGTQQEIVPVEVVPASLPVQYTISPARLP
jgi:hypothetical protein